MRKHAPVPRNYFVHAANNALDSWKMFCEDPDYGGKIKEFGSRMPSWDFLNQYKPGNVVYKPRKNTTADPIFYPARLTYKNIWKMFSEIKLPKSDEPCILPMNLDTLLKLHDKVLKMSYC